MLVLYVGTSNINTVIATYCDFGLNVDTVVLAVKRCHIYSGLYEA
jgi:hypothetical protein